MTSETVAQAGIAVQVGRVRERIAAAAQRAGRATSEITLIAVTKTMTDGPIRQAVVAGVRDLGENKVQEAAGKVAAFAAWPTLRWHLLGHLQRNKARRAVALFPVIHSIDSLDLASTVSQEAQRAATTVEVFAQVNVSGEDTKSGFAVDAFLRTARALAELPALSWRGIMTIGPEGAGAGELHALFAATRRLQAQVREEFQGHAWDALSMGMSNDFEIAIEEGATHVRVGRAIFGERTAEIQA